MPVIVSCPSCEKALQVPEEFFGRMVQCPECKTMFQAQPKADAPSPPTEPERAGRESTFEAPFSKAPLRESKQRRIREDDDDVDNLRRRPQDYVPDRGGMILTLGIISLVGGFIACLPAFIGPAAWMMGNHDLAEIKAGRMNPEGRSNTETGRVLGMVSTLLLAFSLAILCGIFALAFVVAVG